MERLTRYTDYEILLEKGLDILVEEPEDFDNLQHVLSVLAAYEDTGLTPEQIMELKKQIPPCKVGDTVYIITKCKNIPAQLDGTMYGPDGGFGTAATIISQARGARGIVHIAISEKQAEIVVRALEKQTPKKATFIKTVMGLMVFQCNACGKQFFAKTNLGHYCTYCGQKLRAE